MTEYKPTATIIDLQIAIVKVVLNRRSLQARNQADVEIANDLGASREMVHEIEALPTGSHRNYKRITAASA